MFSVLCAVDCSYFAFAEDFRPPYFRFNARSRSDPALGIPLLQRSWYSLSSLSILEMVSGRDDALKHGALGCAFCLGLVSFHRLVCDSGTSFR